MKNKMTLNARPQRQQGAALVIGLVLLTVLTLLTASSMTSSTLSLRMADNVKQDDIASQAAESALMRALTSNAPYTFNSGVVLGDEVRAPLEFDYLGANAAAASSVVTTRLRDRLQGTLEGCEEDAKKGGSGCIYQHFEMNVVTTSSRGGTQSQDMGFYIRVPN